jgi:hypothetical protein
MTSYDAIVPKLTIFDNPATNLAMINICSSVGSMAHTSNDRYNNFGQNNYYSNYLNHAILHL